MEAETGTEGRPVAKSGIVTDRGTGIVAAATPGNRARGRRPPGGPWTVPADTTGGPVSSPP